MSEPAPTDPVAELRAWCGANGHHVLAGDRVFAEAAAAIIGRSTGTLENWRTQGHDALPFQRPGGRGGRVTYRLADLAKFNGAD